MDLMKRVYLDGFWGRQSRFEGEVYGEMSGGSTWFSLRLLCTSGNS